MTATFATDWQALTDELCQRFDVVDETIEVAGVEYRLLHPRSADDLINEKDFDIDERLPYWAEFWPSGRVLAGRVARMQGQGRRFLELGCGAGLVSAVAASRGFDVTATDYYDEAISFTRLNAHRNGLPPLDARTVDWRRWPDELGRFDVVVAADVVYEKPYPALVAEVFLRTLAPQGLGLMADPGRPGIKRFVEECRARALNIRACDHVRYDDGKVRPTVEVHEITRTAGAAHMG
jgi:ETFB lysine methyltransferase